MQDDKAGKLIESIVFYMITSDQFHSAMDPTFSLYPWEDS